MRTESKKKNKAEELEVIKSVNGIEQPNSVQPEVNPFGESSAFEIAPGMTVAQIQA